MCNIYHDSAVYMHYINLPMRIYKVHDILYDNTNNGDSFFLDFSPPF